MSLKLSERPAIHPTAHVTDATLGRYTEVGAGCHGSTCGAQQREQRQRSFEHRIHHCTAFLISSVRSSNSLLARRT